MTVAALGEQMSSSELAGWAEFLALENEERNKKTKES